MCSFKLGHKRQLDGLRIVAKQNDDRVVFGMVDTSLNVSRKLEMLSRANWSAVIQTALCKLGGQAELQEIYQVIEADAPQTISKRPNWQARIRATLQSHFRNVERGVWAVAA